MKKLNKILKKLRLRTLISLGLIIIILPIIIFVMFRPQSTDASWYDERYQYRKILTIDDTNVSGSNSLTNFPVLVNLTSDQSLNDNAQADGDDIIFVSSTGTLLDFEIESYATGTLVAWVEIPSLSGSTDTSFYMYYGSPSASSLENPSGIWGDSIYQAVYHFNNNLNDSSSNGRTGTNNGTIDTSGGKIGNGRDFENSESDYVDIGTWNVTGQALTLSGWVKIESFPVGTDFRFISKADGTSASNHTWMVGSTDDNARARLTTTSTVTYLDTLDNDYTATDTWYNFAFTYDGTNGRLYVNGVQTYFAGQTGDITSNAKSILLGANPTPASNFLDGIMDEIRIISATRSADWLATEYTNQNNSSSFLSLSAEQSRILPPLAYWNLDQGVDNTCSGGTNDVCDSSSGASDGAKTGASWQPEDLCVSGKCLLFDGTDDTVTVSNTLSNTQSVSFWVKIMSTSTTEQILDLNGTDYFTSTSGVLTVNGFGTDTIYVDAVSGATTLSTNKWHFVTVTSTSGFSSSAIKMGQISTNYGNLFLDEVKLYNYALSANEIKSAFASRGLKVQTNTSLGGENQRFLSDGLVGYWSMEEAGDATRSDSSGNTNTLTESTSDTVAQVAGKFGYGGDFELADTEYMTAADSTSLSVPGSVTLSAWINPETVSAGSYNIIGKWDGTNESYRLFQNGDEIRLEIDSAGNYQETSSANLSASTWYHILGVYDSNSRTVQIFINGSETTSTTTGTIPSSIGDDAGVFAIGAEDTSTSATGYYDGIIDQARVYNRALSPAEVERLYLWAPSPVGYWPLDENTGTNTTYDRSGNGLNGTLTSITQTSWVSGKYGSGLSLDGSADFVDIGTGPTQVNTVAFWVYPETTTEYFVNITSTTDYIWVNAGTVTATGFSSPTIYVNGVPTTTLVADQWQHIAVVTSTSENASNLDIGRVADASYLEGKIDDVRIYNYPRNVRQIVEDMNGGHPLGGSPITSKIGHYTFDEMNGTTANNLGTSGSTNNGTIGSGVTWTTTSSCKFNSCLSFNGTTGYVEPAQGVGAAAYRITGDISYSLWFNADSIADGEYLFHQGETGSETEADNDLYSLRWDTTSGNDLEYNHENGAGTDNTNIFDVNLSTGVWYQAILVRNATAKTVKLYINGILKGTYTYSNDPSGGGSGEHRIGSNDDGGDYFDGYIDEVKIYNSALSDSEVLIDYNANSAINFGSGINEMSATYGGPGGNPPLGYWPMDDNVGSTTDSVKDVSGNNNPGDMLNMGEENWIPGKYGSAISFDGSTEAVSINPSTTFNNMAALTLSGWVYVLSDGGSGIGRIVSKSGWSFYVSDSGSTGDFGFYRTTSGTEVRAEAADNTLTHNTWNHVAVTWNGTLTASTGIHLYINGKEVSYKTQQNGTGTVSDDSANIILYGAEVGGSFRYHGYLDDQKIWNTALTPAQIAYEYNRGKAMVWWKFDECQGSTAYDASGNSYNGTITPGASGNTSVGTCSSGISTEMWNDGTTGKRNSSLGFDGTDDYVTVTSNANLTLDSSTQDFSIFAWVKRTTTGEMNIISKEDADNDGWRLQFTSGDVVRCSVDSIDIDSTSTITDTNWHHVGCTIDRDGNGQVYIDGLANGSTTAISSEAMANTSNVYIGTRSYTSANYFSGQIDDLRLYNYVVTPSQVKKIMNDDAAVRFGPDSGNP